jgi:cytosine/adenosine deaminase-related metal-dependent hydrolase
MWHMATRAGALALGLDTGEIAPNKLADITFLDYLRPELLPLLDDRGLSTAAHNLMLTGDGRMVKHVMTHGQWILQDGQSTLIDEREFASRYRNVAGKVFLAPRSLNEEAAT